MHESRIRAGAKFGWGVASRSCGDWLPDDARRPRDRRVAVRRRESSRSWLTSCLVRATGSHQGQSGDSVILPGTFVARDTEGTAPSDPNGVAGGDFSTDVNDALGLEIGVVGPSECEEARS